MSTIVSARSSELNHSQLFWIGVLALFTAAMSASMRATVASDIKTEFLDPIDLASSGTMIGESLGAAFLGFAFTLFFTSPLLDNIGMGRLLRVAAGCFIAGTLITVFADSVASGTGIFWCIWSGMFLMGVGWGAVEATINPMTATLYPDEKTHRLNVLHAWWPAGLIVGGLTGVAFGAMAVSWQFTLALVLLPASIFGYMTTRTTFPVTARAQAGISVTDMMKEVVRRPSFFIWFAAMFLTAATELAPGQWVDIALTQKVGMRGIFLLIYISGLMFVMRHFAGPLAHRLSNSGLLWCSSLLAAVGLFLLGRADSAASAFVAATFWGAGVCFMWPTMLATISERYPDGGSWLVGLLGSAGALSTYFVLPQLGAMYDEAKIELAGGPEQLALLSAEALAEIEGTATAQSFEAVAMIPLSLLIVFGAIWLYDRKTGQSSVSEASV
jgi:MFS family permease